MNTLTHIIDHCVTLYMPITKPSGEYITPEMSGAGFTKDGLIDTIMTGNLDDVIMVLCIWGNEAGTDQTDMIRGECFDIIDWYGDVDDIDRNTPDFVKAHKDYTSRRAEHVKEVAEQQAHEASERRGY